jgi:hypothetical protein
MLKQVFILMAALMAFSCQRSVSDSSKVSIQLPNSNSVSSLSGCTQCLKGLVVNVSGNDFKTIVLSQRHASFEENNTELSNEITVEVPAGEKRQFQIMAIYRDSSANSIVLQYGSTLADLNAEQSTLNLSLNNIGVFKGGSLVGRYLTGINSGPTGKVTISMNPPGGLEIIFDEGEILNGWFNFFASENIPITYRLEDGSLVFNKSNITLDNILPLTGGTLTSNVTRFKRPSSYYSYNGASWDLVNEPHDVIYGFFGSSVLTANKFVCSQIATANFSSLAASSDGSSPLYYSDSNPAADVYRVGGGTTSTQPVGCASADTSIRRFDTNTISIIKDQFDGKGNDTATSLGGAFSYTFDAGNPSKYLRNTTLDQTFRALPGLFDGVTPLFNGAELYVKSGAVNGGYDNIKCNAIWLAINGFQKVSPSVVAVSVVQASNEVELNFASPNPNAATDGYILCPTKFSLLTGLGGLYIGKIL